MFGRPRKQPDFKELVNDQDWQKIQDIFSSMTNISLRTIDPEGKLITTPSGQSQLCQTFLKDSTYGMEVCGDCLPTFLGGKSVVDRNLSFVCPSGFHNFFAPVKLNSKVLAYIILGPVVLVMRKPKDSYKGLADELDVDLDALWEAISKVRVISFHRAQTLMELIVKFSEFILSLAFENSKDGKRFPDALFAQFKGMLEVLLDLALQISGADMGSIMLLDKKKEELTIRAARGLPENVVRDTRIKLGTGLCATAVMENRPLLIDDKLSDNRIKQYLNRPYLKSSMILPFGTEEEAIGAINLGALEVSPVRFSPENLQIMHKVIGQAVDALYTPFKEHMPSKAAYLEKLL
jgi:ligand-binding sensor protein/putative methionine-R-sulfoxide reductase with GAF domain